MVRDDIPNETQRSVVLSFMQHGQEEILQPYVEKYLEGRRHALGGEGD